MIRKNQNDSGSGRQDKPSPSESLSSDPFSTGSSTPLPPLTPAEATGLVPRSSARRVLHLIASNFVGGPEKQILRHATDCRADGQWEIWIGSFRDGKEPSQILARAREIGLSSLEIQGRHFNPWAVWEVASLLRQHDIAILCTHGYKANILGWMARRIFQCPQIAFARGWTAETWRVRLYEKWDRILLGRMDWIVCISRALAEELQNRRKGRRLPIVIPNTATYDFEPANLDADRKSARRDLGLTESAFVVGAVGRLSAEKGHRYLLEAVPSLSRRDSNLLVIILGEGRERVKLERRREDLRIQGLVSFKGFQNDVRPWIQAMDVMVNPSLTEGMPNAILEAMALGTPVVATAVGGVPDIIRDGETGLLVPSADSAALAEAVLRVRGDCGLAVRLAGAAQTWVHSHFSPERQQRQLFELYETVLAGAAPRKSLVRQDVSVGFRPTATFASRQQTPNLPEQVKQTPYISVVIPVRNEGANIGAVLQDLLQQNYPPDRFEIIVVDGNSIDETREVVEEFQKRSIAKILLLANPGQLSSAGRNMGVKASRGDLIMFVDGHCHIPSRTLLQDIAELFESTGADCLCRPQPLTMPGNTRFQDAVAHVRGSSLGHGRDSTIYSTEFEGEVNPSSSGALYRREVFERVGYFDEKFDACEDVEFNYRIFKAGLRSYFSPRLTIFYRPRSGLRALFQQMMRYGRGRQRLIRKHTGAFSISQAVPAVFLLWLIGGGIFSFFSLRIAQVFLITLAVYATALFSFAAGLALRCGWRQLFLAPAIYLSIHLGLGAGFLAEGIWPTRGSSNSSNCESGATFCPAARATPNDSFETLHGESSATPLSRKG